MAGRQWWGVSYDITQGDLILRGLRDLRVAVDRRRGFKDFFTIILTHPRGAPGFFRDMFEARGTGDVFFSRSWKPLSAAWLQEKRSHGWDARIGFRKTKLFRTLTVPGSSENILRVTPERGIYGTKVSDGKGKKYGAKFNTVRPFIDAKTMADLRLYLLAGKGREAFLAAERTLRAVVLSGVTRGASASKFTRII